MKKPAELYVISEPEAPVVPDAVPAEASPSPDAEPPLPRERSWRDLMRRLQQNQR